MLDWYKKVERPVTQIERVDNVKGWRKQDISQSARDKTELNHLT